MEEKLGDGTETETASSKVKTKPSLYQHKKDKAGKYWV
jgi:hypothetical protein